MTGKSKRKRLARKRPHLEEHDGMSVAIAVQDTHKVRSLAKALSRKNGFEVAVLSTPQAVRRLVRPPSILVIELDGDGFDGKQVRDISRNNPGLRIVALGPHNGDPLHVIENGATILLDPESDGHGIVEVVAELAQGRVLLDPEITAAVVRRLHELARICNDDGIDPQRCGTLSNREREVCELLSRGLGNDHIADRLEISPGTVKTHVHNVLGKLEVHDRRTAGAYWRLYRQSGPGMELSD